MVHGMVVITLNVIIFNNIFIYICEYLGPTDRTTESITENKKHFRIHCNYISSFKFEFP